MIFLSVVLVAISFYFSVRNMLISAQVLSTRRLFLQDSDICLCPKILILFKPWFLKFQFFSENFEKKNSYAAQNDKFVGLCTNIFFPFRVKLLFIRRVKSVFTFRSNLKFFSQSAMFLEESFFFRC